MPRHPLLSVSRRPVLVAATLIAFALPASAAAPAAERVTELAGWLPLKPIGLGEPLSNRAAWTRLAAEPGFTGVVAQAAALARQEIPPSPDELFLEFSRNGNRTRWQNVASQRRARVITFTLAECLENRGRFLAPLGQTFQALCAEKTWVMPAHDRGLRNFNGQTIEIDLGAAMLGWDLATAQWLLGDALAPATRQLLAENLRRRIFEPFRAGVQTGEPALFWLTANHNWNAVCLAGVNGAAQAALEAPEDRAWFAAAAERNVRAFLSGFTPDGYCSEGLGYWDYGFGHFLMLGETLRRVTGGRLDLLANPAARAPALFAARAEILNGLYPTIADCHPGTQPPANLMHYLNRRLRLDLPAWRTAPPPKATGALYGLALFAFPAADLPAIPGAAPLAGDTLRTWFADGGVLICRPAPGDPPFAVCLKGGHNAEHHNHNDVGSFSVVSGRAMVLCDPGAEVYTARTFSNRRYDSRVLNSYGHAVPVVAGTLQRAGAPARAKVLRTDFTDAADTLRLDLRPAYEAPALVRLEREFTFRRGRVPSLTVVDEAEFNSPTTFETALVTWGTCERISATEFRVTDDGGAVRVRLNTGGLPFELKTETLNEDVQTRTKPVRLGFRLTQPVERCSVRFEIRPDSE